jgi:hypothetical protein
MCVPGCRPISWSQLWISGAEILIFFCPTTLVWGWFGWALDELNGHPIRTPNTCISLASVLPRDSEISLDRKIPAGLYQSLMATLASDASDTAVAAFCIDGLPQFEMVSELSVKERTYSS